MAENYKNKNIVSTKYQIKKIHTLKTILGLDDDLYRDMLMSFGVLSSKNLTQGEAKVLIEILEDKVNELKIMPKKKFDELDNRENMATPLQLRKLEALWADISGKKDKKKTLREFLNKHFHVDDLRFLTKKRASQIIAVFEKIKVQMCLKAF